MMFFDRYFGGRQRRPPDATLVRAQIDEVLDRHMIKAWYPAAFDLEYGGFLTDLDWRWTPIGSQNKYTVVQARHVWSLSMASEWTGDETYLEQAVSGLEFLRSHLWDAEFGGYLWTVTRDGRRIDDPASTAKATYAHAFVIFGAARLFLTSGRHEALDVAKETFLWLDGRAHDSTHGGYFQQMNTDGSPVEQGQGHSSAKSTNSMLHMLEALTELYRAWPDATAGARLAEAAQLIRTRLISETLGAGTYFSADWTPFRSPIREGFDPLDHVAFGHETEAAALLVAAARALGQESEATWTVAKTLMDRALSHGWDEKHGGFFDAGRHVREGEAIEISRTTKAWWAQAESLNTLHLLAHRFPDDPADYDLQFRRLWAYIYRYVIDRDHGGWFENGLDVDAAWRRSPKAHSWKTPYHTLRSLLCVCSRDAAAG